MKKKKFLSILLSIVTVIGLFSGCGDSQETETKIKDLETEGGANQQADAEKEQKMGRFMETEVTLPVQPEKIYCLGMTSENTMTAFVQDEKGTGYLLHSADMGETWDSKQADAVMDGYITVSGVTPDGGALLVGSFEEDYDKWLIKKIAADGSVSSSVLQLPENSNQDMSGFGNMPYQGGVDAAGNLFVKDLNGNVLQADPETGACTKVGDDNADASYIALAGEKLLMISKNGVALYHTSDGKKQPQDTVLDDIIRSDASLGSMDSDRALPMLFTAGVEEGSIVYANHEGVFYHREGGSMAEQLINGELSSLGDGGISLYGMVMPDEEHFMMHISDTSGNEKMIKFSYDKNISATPEKELKVYALNDSSVLRHASAIFQKQNQNLYVNVEIGMNGADGITAEDAVSALNTKILAGDAPDILVLDGLPVDSYIEKGILADISGLVRQLDESDGLFTNISECYNKNGVYYELPVRFFPLLAVGDPDVVDAGKNIADYADVISRMAETGETDILPARKAEMLLKILYQADGANWLKEDGSLDAAGLEEWLLAAKKLYDVNEEAENEESGATDFFESQLMSTLNETYLFTGMKSAFGSMVDIFGYVGLLATQDETGCSYGTFGGSEGDVFVPYLSVGISSTSTVREEAEAFFGTLFGKECCTGSGGFPINRAGWQEISAKAREDYGPDSMISVGFGGPGEESYGYMMNTYDEQAETELNKLLESLTVRSARQDTAWQIVAEAAESYLKGELSVDEALAAIQQKLTLYLAEM